MDREKRTVAITALCCLMYGLFSFPQYHVFIFPTPIHEILFLGIVVYFAALHFKDAKMDYTAMIALAISHIFAKEYNWDLFLGPEKMAALSKSLVTDRFQLLFYALVLLGMIRFYVVNRLLKYAWSAVLSVGFYVWGIVEQHPLLFFAGLVIFMLTQGLLYWKKPELVAQSSKSIYYLWFLLAFFTALNLSNFYL